MAAAAILLFAALAVVVARPTDAPRCRHHGPVRRRALPPDSRSATSRCHDQDGRRVDAGSTCAGARWSLTFLYTTCRDTCPIIAEQIETPSTASATTSPSLAVSVDPAHDTPALARRFLLPAGLSGRMRFLLGTRAQLAPIWKAYGIQPQGKGFEHSAYVLLLDRSGRRRVSWPVSQLTPEGLAHDLRRLESLRA